MKWTLADLRAANEARQALWCPGQQLPDLSFRGNELAGETGEACNEIKKLERERLGWRGSRSTIEKLATELADVVICADLCALSAGINLMDAVRAKFDEISDKVGLPTKLAAVEHSVPAGYVLAPLEPTPEMKQAWAEYRDRCLENGEQKTAGGHYRAMLAARPKV